ncbi:TetR family transcriptional regulator [Pyxidicoccus caerfyrddinensis]|uniref:TetR family transcriptional regulator n=1 Tax=Pyxidicoccus caerfyrddinensis TaxID=2709663 RepID=UPI0013DBAD40|nr:TetR family transcriptional regulator [Pyxidicoccus caerfyrddinensis]
MTARPTPRISSRKKPLQARSEQLVADILAAAIQVLAREGADRFTTIRVAEKAGISIGSLYQYFPNKAAILFRLQTDEWRQTGALLRGILEDSAQPPLERLREFVHAFIRSECEEARVRMALDEAAPRYREEPEAREPRVYGTRVVQSFMREVLPSVPDEKRVLAGDMIMMTLSTVGKRLSEEDRTEQDVEARAGELADMFRAYLEQLAASGPG